ncbi:Urease accessory protein UreD [Streptomyces glaucescens]
MPAQGRARGHHRGPARRQQDRPRPVRRLRPPPDGRGRQGASAATGPSSSSRCASETSIADIADWVRARLADVDGPTDGRRGHRATRTDPRRARRPGRHRAARARRRGPLAPRRTRGNGGEAPVMLVGAMSAPLGGDRLRVVTEVAADARLRRRLRRRHPRPARPAPGRGPLRRTAHRRRRRRTALAARAVDLRRRQRPERAHRAADLAAGARLVLREEQVLGRTGEEPGPTTPAASPCGSPAGACSTRNWPAGPGRPGGWDGPAGLGGHRAVGQLVVVRPEFAAAPGGRPVRPGTGAAVLPLAGPAVLLTAVAPDALQLRQAAGRGAGGPGWAQVTDTPLSGTVLSVYRIGKERRPPLFPANRPAARIPLSIAPTPGRPDLRKGRTRPNRHGGARLRRNARDRDPDSRRASPAPAGGRHARPTGRPRPAGQDREATGRRGRRGPGRPGRASTGRTARRTGTCPSRSSAAGSPSRSTTPSRTASRSSSPSTASATPAPRPNARAPSSTTPAAPAAPVCASRARVTTKNAGVAERRPGVRLRRLRPARRRRDQRPSPASTRRSSSRRPSRTRCPTPRPTSSPSASSAREYAEGCYERSGAMLPHMTTPNTARDLDVIRTTLGEKQLNFLGVSYGTYLGAVYGTLFPGHVRRMVTDSVVNPSREKIWYQANLDQDVAFETRWQDWQDWVAKNDATFHLGDHPRRGPGPVAPAARHRQEGTRSAGSSARPNCPASSRARRTTTPPGAGRLGLQQVRRRGHPGPRRRRRPRPDRHRGQRRLARTATPSTRRSSAPTPSGRRTGSPGTGTTPGCTATTRPDVSNAGWTAAWRRDTGGRSCRSPAPAS